MQNKTWDIVYSSALHENDKASKVPALPFNMQNKTWEVVYSSTLHEHDKVSKVPAFALQHA